MHLVPEGEAAHGHHHHGHAAGEQTPAASAAAPWRSRRAPSTPARCTRKCAGSSGNCPKCGMTLEPMLPLDEEDNSELRIFSAASGGPCR
jgi:Cu+-exporting ATPase